jgi:hypothetical protein
MVVLTFRSQLGISIALVVIFCSVLFGIFLWKLRHCRRRGQSVFLLFVLPVLLDLFAIVASFVLAISLPLLFGAFLGDGLNKPMSWFCSPILAFFLYGSPAVIGILLVRWLVDWLHEQKLPKPYMGEYEIIDGVQYPPSLMILADESFSIAVLFFWSILVVLTAVANLGAIYIPTLFLSFGSSGLILSVIVRIMTESFAEDKGREREYNTTVSKYWWVNLLISTIIPVAFLMYVLYIFTAVEIPTTGRSGATFPADIVIAALVGAGCFLR